MPIVVFLTGLFVGALFVTSGVDKLRSGSAEVQVARYEIVPDRLVRVAGLLLPIVELLLGVALLIGLLARPALILSAVMLTAFTAAVVVNLRRGRDIDCGCRSDSKPISWGLAAQDLALGVVCLVAATQPSIGPWRAFTGHGAVGAMDAVALIIDALLAWVLLQLVLVAYRAHRNLASYGTHA